MCSHHIASHLTHPPSSIFSHPLFLTIESSLSKANVDVYPQIDPKSVLLRASATWEGMRSWRSYLPTLQVSQNNYNRFQYTFLLYSLLSLCVVEVSEEKKRFLAIVVCDEKSRPLPGRTFARRSASSVAFRLPPSGLMDVPLGPLGLVCW